MSDTFEIGTIVKLKSGGPEMTVTSEVRDGKVFCKWFLGAKSHTNNYPIAALIPIADEEVPIADEEDDPVPIADEEDDPE